MEALNNFRIIYENEFDLNRNLALEEAILISLNGGNSTNTFRLWINEDSAIAPFHESIFKLIDVEYCLRGGIKLGRRITGGGAIYNDEGNLNWSFFVQRKPYEKFSLIELYRYFSSYIVKALSEIGIELEFREPNWLSIKGKKVSGMAGYIKSNSILIHGTLLVDANLDKLEKVCKEHYKYPPVMNISEIKSISINELIHHISNWMKKKLSEKSEVTLADKPSEYELKLAEKLKEEKYEKISWIFSK
ncbi:MAG: lipoate--protein ligase family protein [Thermoproteota archaeon]|nr:lipoate--protein ligase family protein [Thermoproteota archaeon]